CMPPTIPRTRCGRPSWLRKGQPSFRAIATANMGLPGEIIIRHAWILRTEPCCGRIRNMRRVLLPASGPRAGSRSKGSEGGPGTLPGLRAVASQTHASCTHRPIGSMTDLPLAILVCQKADHLCCQLQVYDQGESAPTARAGLRLSFR